MSVCPKYPQNIFSRFDISKTRKCIVCFIGITFFCPQHSNTTFNKYLVVVLFLFFGGGVFCGVGGCGHHVVGIY